MTRTGIQYLESGISGVESKTTLRFHYISTWSAKMERKNLTRWAVYQSDVKYKLWNAKNIYDIIKLTTFAAFVKPPSYIRKKLKSFFAVFANC